MAEGENGAGAVGRVPPFQIEGLVPTADSRGLDPMSRFLTAATALALRDADLSVRGSTRDQIGLLVGTITPSPRSMQAFRESIENRGLRGISASAFARIVLNAPAGCCSKLLSLRGPLSTISTGTGSGLAAIVLAAELMCTRDDVNWMVAAGVDEAGFTKAELDEESCAERAVSVVLGTAAQERGSGNGNGVGDTIVLLNGWGLAGPGQLSEAIGRARAGRNTGRTDVTFCEEDWMGPTSTREEAAASALACAEAVLALRRGEAEQALVTSGCGNGVSAALFLSLGKKGS